MAKRRRCVAFHRMQWILEMDKCSRSSEKNPLLRPKRHHPHRRRRCLRSQMLCPLRRHRRLLQCPGQPLCPHPPLQRHRRQRQSRLPKRPGSTGSSQRRFLIPHQHQHQHQYQYRHHYRRLPSYPSLRLRWLHRQRQSHRARAGSTSSKMACAKQAPASPRCSPARGSTTRCTKNWKPRC